MDPTLPPTPHSLTPANFEDEEDEEEESDIELDYGAPATAAPEDAFFQNFSRSRLSSSIHHLGIILNSKRKAALEPIHGATTAWIDQDDSGTYDPNAKAARPTAKRSKRVKLAADANGGPKSQKSFRRAGYSLKVSFSFTDKKALEYLRSITPGPDDSETGSGSDEEVSDSESSDDESGSGPRRTRRKVKAPKRLGVVADREDGLTLDALTEGHPQRRGCKACFQLGNDDCTLIEDAYDYPCTACDDADMECELIVPPKLKKSCEACKRKRNTCSYREDGGNGVDVCKACASDSETCCAAPLKESAYTKRFTKPPVEVEVDENPVADRIYIQCCPCRTASLQCSLRRRNQPGPCKQCRQNNDDCTFVLEAHSNAIAKRSKILPPPKSKSALKKKHRARTPNVQHAPNSLSSPTRSWETLGKDAEKEYKKSSRAAAATKSKSNSRRGISPTLTARTQGVQHILLSTSFAHPIRFNYIPDPSNLHLCSWCSYPFFGLWGYGEVTVEVIPWGGDLGYEEIDGPGHAIAGKEGSRMCVECTFIRVRIMTCQGHKIRRFETYPAEPAFLESSFAALAAGDREGGKLAVETRWCSICVAVAEYKCCADQPFGGGAGEEGCGLFLCAICNDTYGRITKSMGGNSRVVVLDCLVKVRGEELWKQRDEADRVRADAGFLTMGGELMVRMRQGMGGEGDGEAEVGGGEEGGLGRDVGMEKMVAEEVGRGGQKENLERAREKGKEMVLGGELALSKSRTTGSKGDRKGKGKAAPGVEYVETKNGYRAKPSKASKSPEEEADLKEWKNMMGTK